MFQFLRKTALWILLAPVAIWGAGLCSNQLVLFANHDTFPVMLSEAKVYDLHIKLEKEEIKVLEKCKAEAKKCDKDATQDALSDLRIKEEMLNHGYLDDVHVIMTSDTHLNWLADVFDLYNTYSIGDFLLMLGEWLQVFCT